MISPSHRHSITQAAAGPIPLRERGRAASRPPRALAAGLAFVFAAGFATMAQFPDAPREELPPLPERQKAVLKEFDLDHDGRLNAGERETARLAWAKIMLTPRRERGFFGPPPELLQEFDTNKDGDLDEEEGRIARETMEKRFTQMRKDYDRNANGRLEPEEIAAASKDIDDGKLKGIPRMFLQFAAGDPPRRGPGGPRGPGGRGDGAREEIDPTEVVRAADRDGDGRLSANELELARAARAKLRAEKLKAAQEPATRP